MKDGYISIEEVKRIIEKALSLGYEVRGDLLQKPFEYKKDENRLWQYCWDYYNDDDGENNIVFSQYEVAKINKKGEIVLFYRCRGELCDGEHLFFTKRIDAKELL